MRGTSSLIALTLIVASVLLSLAALPANAQGTPAVVVQVGGDSGQTAHNMFWPDTSVVHEGDIVQWQSVATDTPHTVTALPAGGPPLFDTSPNVTQAALGPLFGPGGVLSREGPAPAEFSHTFDTPGTFTIRCKIHPEMLQTITVANDTVHKENVLSIAGGGGAHASTDFFSPATLDLSKGQMVTWTALGPEPHTVTGYSGVHNETPVLLPPAFDSSPALTPAVQQTIGGFFADPLGFFKPQQTFNFTFAKAGTYLFFCKLHSGMRGSVVVLPALSSGTTGPTGPTGPTGAAGAKGTPGIGALGVLVAGLAGALAIARVKRQR